MKLLEVARIGKAHGLKGEVSVHLISNISERVESGSVLFLQDRRELLVKSSKQHNNKKSKTKTHFTPDGYTEN